MIPNGIISVLASTLKLSSFLPTLLFEIVWTDNNLMMSLFSQMKTMIIPISSPVVGLSYSVIIKWWVVINNFHTLTLLKTWLSKPFAALPNLMGSEQIWAVKSRDEYSFVLLDHIKRRQWGLTDNWPNSFDSDDFRFLKIYSHRSISGCYFTPGPTLVRILRHESESEWSNAKIFMLIRSILQRFSFSSMLYIFHWRRFLS